MAVSQKTRTKRIKTSLGIPSSNSKGELKKLGRGERLTKVDCGSCSRQFQYRLQLILLREGLVEVFDGHFLPPPSFVDRWSFGEIVDSDDFDSSGHAYNPFPSC